VGKVCQAETKIGGAISGQEAMREKEHSKGKITFLLQPMQNALFFLPLRNKL
jgi:hypothetical protein